MPEFNQHAPSFEPDDATPHEDSPLQPASLPPHPFADQSTIITAELVETHEPSFPPARPLLWPAIAVVLTAILIAVFVSTVMIGLSAVATGQTHVLGDSDSLTDWLVAFASTPLGLIVMILPGQIVFAVMGMAAAHFSNEPWRQRLGLGEGRLPMWSWPLLLIGTPMIGVLGAMLTSPFGGEQSEHLQLFEKIFVFHSAGKLVLLLGLVSLLPGIAEEILFRGFLQRRLLQRLPAVFAIAICSIFFAAAHMDPMHALGVLPLGIWLGFVAWRADSIWPAIFGHIGNNGSAIILSKVMGSGATAQPLPPMAMALFGVSLTALLGSVAVIVIWGQKQRSPFEQATIA